MRKIMPFLLSLFLFLSSMGGTALASSQELKVDIKRQTHILNKKLMDDSVKNQLEEIDKLAQKYYNYYVKQGYIKDGKLVVGVDKLRRIVLDENGKPVNISIQSVSPSQTVAVLQQLGVYMTTTQVAQECAILGTLAAIDGPIPVGDFLALCVGVYFICEHVSNYVSHQNAICSEISTNVSSTCATNAANSIAQADTVRRNSQYNHFEAWRYWGPGGGITIGNPLTEDQAVVRLKAKQDVWSRTKAASK